MVENGTKNQLDKGSSHPGTVMPPGKSKIEDNRKHLIKVIVVIFIFMIVFTACSYYLWDRVQDVNIVAQQAADNSASQSEATSRTIRELESRIDQLSEQQRTLMDSLSALYQQQPASNEDWALAEIEYLLIIANHHLFLLHDVDTALVTMEAAELRLRDMRGQQLLPVREQLVADINELRSINAVNISSLAAYLADLIDRSDTLPLKADVIFSVQDDPGDTDAAHDNTGWRNVLDSIWQEIKSLLVIKRSGEVREAILLPDQEYFLYQNLRLELESARLSILRRDTENLRISIHMLSDWLSQYFDIRDTGVVNILETLEYMTTIEFDPELPDINSSLESLRAYVRARESVEPLPDQNIEAPTP